MAKKTELGYSKERLIRQARQIRWVTRALGTCLAAVLGVQKLMSERFTEVTTSVSADFLLNFCMVVHFTSLTVASSYDTNLIEKVALRPTNQGIFSFSGLAIVLLLAVAFVFLWSADGFKEFSIFLLIFWTINFGAWCYLAYCSLPSSFSSSRADYMNSRRWGQLERLRIVEHYICGRWQVIRFGVGYVLIVILIAMSFSRFAHMTFSSGIAGEFVVAVSIMVYLFVVVGWMWVQRVRTTFALDVIEELDVRYEIRKGKSADPLG